MKVAGGRFELPLRPRYCQGHLRLHWVGASTRGGSATQSWGAARPERPHLAAPRARKGRGTLAVTGNSDAFPRSAVRIRTQRKLTNGGTRESRDPTMLATAVAPAAAATACACGGLASLLRLVHGVAVVHGGNAADTDAAARPASSAQALHKLAPPGDMGLPWIGETMDMVSDRYKFFYKRVNQWGSLCFSTRLFGLPMVISNSVEINSFVLRAETQGLAEPGRFGAVLQVVGKSSLFTQTGKAHVRLRKLMGRSFTPEVVKNYVNVVDRCVLKLLEELVNHTKALKPGETISSTVFSRLALEVLLRTALQEDLPEAKLRRIVELATTIVQGALSIIPWALPFTALWRALRARRELAEFVEELINKIRAAPPGAPSHNSLLGRLVSATEDATEAPLTQEELLDGVILIILAGYDTTSKSFGTLMSVVFDPDNADCLSKLREAVAMDFGTDPSKALDPDLLRKSVYLNAVIGETWRAVPPVLAFARKATQDVALPGTPYVAPKGWYMNAYAYPAHFSEAFWGPEPTKFVPERFQMKVGDPLLSQYYLPFGGGNRACLGEHLARLELRVLLVRVAQAYDVQVFRRTKKTFILNHHQVEFHIKELH